MATLNPFKWFKRAKPIDACLWDADGREYVRLSLDGDFAKNLKNDETFNTAGVYPIREKHFGKNKMVYHFDRQSGAGIRFERGGDLCTLRTNGILFHNIIDGNLMAQLFAIASDIRMVILAFFLGFFLAGTVFGFYG